LEEEERLKLSLIVYRIRPNAVSIPQQTGNAWVSSGLKKSGRAPDKRREFALQTAVQAGHHGPQADCQFDEEKIVGGVI
jgi:hypothetical protein